MASGNVVLTEHSEHSGTILAHAVLSPSILSLCAAPYLAHLLTEQQLSQCHPRVHINMQILLHLHWQLHYHWIIWSTTFTVCFWICLLLSVCNCPDRQTPCSKCPVVQSVALLCSDLWLWVWSIQHGLTASNQYNFMYQFFPEYYLIAIVCKFLF